MTSKLKQSLFAPIIGRLPLSFPGRDEACATLLHALELLRPQFTETESTLTPSSAAPIKIIGPRGAGKTTLLSWAERQATERGIRVATCERLKENDSHNTLRHLLSSMAGGGHKLLELVNGLNLSVANIVEIGVALERSDLKFKDIVGAIVAKDPLLLLLDEVHHYDLSILATVLQSSQNLISRGSPLAIVLAGTPGLDSHLMEAESTFISRCEDIYINTLSDEDTREALHAPFEQARIVVAPDALEAMAALAGNYPYFIQLVGDMVWKKVKGGRLNGVNEEIVTQIERPLREKQVRLYGQAYDRMSKKGLLNHARQVMGLIEKNQGQVPAGSVIKHLISSNSDVDDGRAHEVYDSLQDDGFIWTINRMTKEGIPSFFNFFKSEEEKECES